MVPDRVELLREKKSKGNWNNRGEIIYLEDSYHLPLTNSDSGQLGMELATPSNHEEKQRVDYKPTTHEETTKPGEPVVQS